MLVRDYSTFAIYFSIAVCDCREAVEDGFEEVSAGRRQFRPRRVGFRLGFKVRVWGLRTDAVKARPKSGQASKRDQNARARFP